MHSIENLLIKMLKVIVDSEDEEFQFQHERFIRDYIIINTKVETYDFPVLHIYFQVMEPKYKHPYSVCVRVGKNIIKFARYDIDEDKDGVVYYKAFLELDLNIFG